MVKKFGIPYRAAWEWLRARGLTTYCPPEVGRPTSTSTAPIPLAEVHRWRDQITPQVVQYYTKERLLTVNTVGLFGLGWDKCGYVIPVWTGAPGVSDVYNAFVRRDDTNENQADRPKYTSMLRRPPAMFNSYVLSEKPKLALIFIGLFDAILAHQDGFIAVTPTGGQGAWDTAWNKLFMDIPRIVVVPDVREATAGFRIASNFIGRAGVAIWPKDFARQGGSDYTDFRRRHSVEQFKTFMLS